MERKVWCSKYINLSFAWKKFHPFLGPPVVTSSNKGLFAESWQLSKYLCFYLFSNYKEFAALPIEVFYKLSISGCQIFNRKTTQELELFSKWIIEWSQSFVLNPIKQFLQLLIVISPPRLFKTFKMQFQEMGLRLVHSELVFSMSLI